jgi:hypothetical protein
MHNNLIKHDLENAKYLEGKLNFVMNTVNVKSVQLRSSS